MIQVRNIINIRFKVICFSHSFFKYLYSDRQTEFGFSSLSSGSHTSILPKDLILYSNGFIYVIRQQIILESLNLYYCLVLPLLFSVQLWEA